MIADILTFLYTVGFLVLGFYGARMGVLALARIAVRRRHPAPTAGGAAPFVTVQLPIFNERQVAARIIDAACRLDWPRDRLEVQVLDDSTDDTRGIVDASVRAWRGRGVDVRVVRRPDRSGFKAGALSFALARARGEAVAVFDADFVPPPDFLRRTLPFLGPGVGVVQARWGHLNADSAWLTRAQALALDGYFMVEQTAHARLGLFLTFNGTAGVWRREAIDAAGGWSGETLTEDVDLSYRAQMAGWKVVFLPDVVAPAELPGTLPAFRRQQRRWAKGTVQVLMKLGVPILRSDRPLAARLLAPVTLGGYLVFPVTLMLLLGAPLLLSYPPHFPGFFGWLWLVPLGPLLAYAVAQAAIEPAWPRRLVAYPYLVALTIGMSYAGTVAVVEALLGRQSPFERTPKTGDGPLGGDVPPVPSDSPGSAASGPASPDAIGWIEGALAVYAWAGLAAAWFREADGLLVFFALYGIGFTLTAGLDLGWPAGGARAMRRAPSP